MKALVLSRNYPSPPAPLRGLWVEGLVRHLSPACEVEVVSPVPYSPPLPASFSIAGFRKIPRSCDYNGIPVHYPRFITGPGMSLHNFEGSTYYHCIRGQVDRLRERFRFDIIHAHFVFPDGWAAANLAKRYGVPLVITEHAFWRPWMVDYPKVRKRAVWASNQAAFHIAVSQAVKDSIAEFAGGGPRLTVIPIGVDTDIFRLPDPQQARNPEQILFVGRIHRTKGVDILLHALALLRDKRPKVQLILIGGNLGFRDYARQEEELRSLANQLGLTANLTFVGEHPVERVAQLMQQSALVVVPSRRESFGAIIIEAMACGTPVVATRCGGPDTTVTKEVGVLVPVEDPESLADAINIMLNQADRFNQGFLNRYALNNFAWKIIAERTRELYRRALAA